MIGVLIILALSWLLLCFIDKKSLLALGFLPVSKRLKQFVIGFLITAALCIGVEMLKIFLSSSSLKLNENLSASLIANMFWWDFKSVLTEELIFRGALLIILIERLGTNRAMLISAAAFGIYHWFSFGLFGNIVPMIVIFIGTGLIGYAWALAFVKTKSILMPLGLHLGWNFTLNTIFSSGPLQNGLLITEGGHKISDWFSLVGLWMVPMVLLLIVRFWVGGK
ncbi:CPBP family intramembrane glutamic endopeptidase [Halocola ammonii]